ncbi:MAG TPA: helix-turn-helix transcriptional regulator [Alphaproteobacteria bacterium]|jgi:AraC-like DNA-binding protein|nr:helix-turn-helix transcriptional regulator [Alphaproteobacteria bacterium]
MRSLTSDETRDRLQSHGLDRPSGIGFAFLDPGRKVFYDWHAHDYHQLLYAIDGPTQIETVRGRHVLPTGRAAWIPSGTHHRTLISDAAGASLYFSPDVVSDPAQRVRILVASPLMREMIVHATRWPLGASETDQLAASFLRTLALMCGEWLEAELPLFLPGAAHPAIVRAMDYAAADLAEATQAGAVAAAAMSERSFRRLFAKETGMGWQAWLSQARILMAMGLLTEGRRVTDVAADVGYASLSAFAAAFTKLAGEAPMSFRQRQTSENARPAV